MNSNSLHPDCEDSSPANQNSSFKNFSQRRILKNLTVLCTGVLLLFIAYDCLTMLQSTMNRKHGIGVISEVVNSICFCASALLFPKYVMKKIGRKATLVISMIMFLPYIASNFYPHWGTLIPSSICLGFGAALYWGTQALYLNDLSVMYANVLLRKKNVLHITDSINCDNRSSNALLENCSNNPKQTRAFLSNYINYNRKRDKTGNNIMLQSFKSQNSKRNCTENVNPPNFSDMAYNEEYTKETNLSYHSLNSKSMEQHNIDNIEKSSVTQRNDRNLKKERQPPVTKQPQSRERNLIESTTALFFGIHSTAYLSCFIWSNLLSYYVLQSGITEDYVSNTTCACGANYCNIESACYEQNIAEPSNKLRYILTGTCVSVGIASVLLVLLFLDSLETHKEEVTFSVELLKATYKQARRKELILLMPSSFYVGMVFGFYSAEYNKSFVACAWGIFHVGLVATSYGAFCGIASLSAGWLVKRVGRIPIFFSATVVNIATNIFFLLWKPTADESVLFFVAAGLWGIFVGVFWSQLRAFYGVLFKADEEAAFAVFHVWFPLGFALSFGYSAYFCTSVKIYLMMVICTVGFVGYVAVEILNRKNQTKKLIT